MKLIVSEGIADVAVRWRRQYESPAGSWKETMSGDTKKIYDKLVALPPTATALDVAKIIGNETWVGTRCTACGEMHQRVIQFSNDDATTVCVPCVNRAHALAGRRSEGGE